MIVDFQDHFWGDKQNGFDVLYQNLKCGSTSAKELAEFLRSRTVMEENSFNFLIKLSRKTGNQQFGTFNPLWIILKSSTEKLSSLHMQTAQRLTQLIKEITKYCDDHHKKQKQIKTEETATIEAINELKETISAHNKAKEFYYAKTIEVDRLKRESASQKDIEKAEARVNKACAEYKNLIDKYMKSKNDYEKKFRVSCKNFQNLEEDHIKQMKEYLASYYQILDSGHALIGQVYKEFQNNCHEMSTERLLELFTKSKGTGTTKLADIQFEEANVNNFQLNLPSTNVPNVTVSGTGSNNMTSNSNLSSSVDLINLDSLPHQSVANFVTTNDFSTPNEPNNLFNSATSYASSSSSSTTTGLRKEGKSFVSIYFGNNVSDSKHSNPFHLGKLSTAKQKRRVYSSHYALSLMDLFASSNATNQPINSRVIEQCLPSNVNVSLPTTSSTNNIVSHVPACASSIIIGNYNEQVRIDSYSKYDVPIDREVVDHRSNVTLSEVKFNDSHNDHHKSYPDVRVNSTLRSSKWFLRSKKDKTKENKKVRNKKEDGDGESNNGSISESKSDRDSTNNNDFIIDSEGYTIRPTQPTAKEESTFDSSSGSDSDSEDEKEKKIFIRIKPKNGAQISASVDQLIASAGALTLAPTTHSNRRANLSANPSPVQNDGTIKRSASATQTALKSNNQNDLFDIFTSQESNTNNANKQETTSAKFANSFESTTGTISKTNDNTKSLETGHSEANNTSNDRYAAFSNLFVMPSKIEPTSTQSVPNKDPFMSSSEGNILPLPPKATNNSNNNNENSFSNSTLSKSISSTQITGPSFSVYRPLSRSFASYSQSISSNGMMSRADSVTSLSSDFRMTPISLCSSRDSSPLTIGMSDTVPIAIAFQESVGACFKGADENLCRINIIGCIKIAFSAGIIQAFSNNPYLQQLSFKLKNINRLDRIILSKELITQIETYEDYTVYEMNMPTLQASLKRLYEQSPNARYYNLDIFKYQFRSLPGAKNAPLQMVSYWKCEEKVTNLKIDFKFNPSAFINSTIQPLRSVQFTANVDGSVVSMNSVPEGKWDSLTKQAIWKYSEVSSSNNLGIGSIKAKFDLSEGTSCPSSVYAQFSAQDTTFSGIEFELIGSAYRLSLVKKQISSGRYYCEPKVQNVI